MEEKKITFDDIQKANETIITTDIKGKDYAEVNQRIKAFRMVHPDGDIDSRLISNENGVCIFRVDVYDGNGKHLGSGTAYEKENSTFINKTSYIENCETSAVGRALGMCGFGIDTSVASAEEVQNAMANQEQAKPNVKTKNKEVMITEQQKEIIKKIYTQEEIKEYLLDVVEKRKLSDLTLVEASDFIKSKNEEEK